MENLNIDELGAVAGHEMTHITEGDMVTTTLLMGTINTFVIFISHLLAIILSGGRNRDEGFGRGTPVLFCYLDTEYSDDFCQYCHLCLLSSS